jgi:hypothetical protein
MGSTTGYTFCYGSEEIFIYTFSSFISYKQYKYLGNMTAGSTRKSGSNEWQRGKYKRPPGYMNYGNT